MRTLFYRLRLFLSRILPLKNVRHAKKTGLLEMVDESRLAWQDTIKEYALVNHELIDYTIYKMIAAEKKFMILLHQARAQKTTAWPAQELKPVCVTAVNSKGNDAWDQQAPGISRPLS